MVSVKNCLKRAQENCTIYKQGDSWVFSEYSEIHGCNVLTEGLTYSGAREMRTKSIALATAGSYLVENNVASARIINSFVYSCEVNRLVDFGTCRERIKRVVDYSKKFGQKE